MRSEKEIKADLLEALSVVGDDIFAEMGFKRRKGTFNYVRTIHDARQSIAFNVDYLPKYEPEEELHIHPAVLVTMMPVTEAALQLVAGNKMLLANAPEVITNQPIDFLAPKSEHVRWFASGLEKMKIQVSEICRFVRKWGVPFMDELATPDDLVRLYKNADKRVMKQRHWYIFIAAAYLLRGDESGALRVLEDNLGAPGLRKRYSQAFKILE